MKGKTRSQRGNQKQCNTTTDRHYNGHQKGNKIMINKILHWKLKFYQREPHYCQPYMSCYPDLKLGDNSWMLWGRDCSYDRRDISVVICDADVSTSIFPSYDSDSNAFEFRPWFSNQLVIGANCINTCRF